MSATTTYPTDADALTEALSDRTVLTEHFSTPEAAAKWITGYASAANEADKGELAEQIKIETQRVMTEMARDNGYMPVDGPAPDADAGRRDVTIYNEAAMGADLDRQLDISNLSFPTASGSKQKATAAHAFQAAWHHQDRFPALAHLNDFKSKMIEVTASYESGLGSAGGFLVPEEFRAQMLRMALETSVVRGRALTLPMSSSTLSLPAIDVTSHASSLFGGVITYWTEESGTMTASEAKVGKVKLEPNTLTGYATMPNQLIADTAFIDVYFNGTFPPAMAYSEDEAFLVGNGVGRPLGALQGGGTVIQAKESGQAADSVVWENIVNMFARLPATSMGRSVWIVNQETIPQLLTMSFSGVPVMIREGGGPDGPRLSMLGLPAIVSEKVPGLGDEGDVNLVDLGFYLIGDRQAMTIDSSDAPRFAQNETAFRIVERVDGRPWVQSPLTPRNGTQTLSPYVRLAERA